MVHLRIVILFSILIFCLNHAHYDWGPATAPKEIPPAPEYVETLQSRKLWLISESLAYALHRETGIPGNYARRVVALVQSNAVRYKWIDSSIVLGLIVVESNGNARALSPVGARGIMQIMPETGKFINASFPEPWKGKHMLYDLETNIRYGIWYLNHLYEEFPGDEHAAIAAYNWGPQNIQWRQAHGHALPRVYPGKVWEAREQIRKDTYEYYATQYWRSLDLSRDPPYFQKFPTKSPDSPRYSGLPGYDGESQLLWEGFRVQQMSGLFLGRN